jgi:hypothetical protein
MTKNRLFRVVMLSLSPKVIYIYIALESTTPPVSVAHRGGSSVISSSEKRCTTNDSGLASTLESCRFVQESRSIRGQSPCANSLSYVGPTTMIHSFVLCWRVLMAFNQHTTQQTCQGASSKYQSVWYASGRKIRWFPLPTAQRRAPCESAGWLDS